MPDPGVYAYVRDVLEKDFQVDVGVLPDHWLPLAIVGTLDWVAICGWWIYRNTGIFDSEDAARFIIRWNNYEFDPDRILVFLDDPERNLFLHRLQNPGIDGKERTEALQFLFVDIFERWYRHEHGYNAQVAHDFYPPQEFIELAMYATFLWILDEYGRDWIAEQDMILRCAIHFGEAFQCKWDGKLLDPREVERTERVHGTCAACKTRLHCVGGTDFRIMDRHLDHPVVQAILEDDSDVVQATSGRWAFLCNHCAMSLATLDGVEIDPNDQRLHRPKCPHWKGIDGEAGGCIATCPHSGMNPEKVWQKMEEVGSERLRQYREHMDNELGGMSPRMVAGQSIDGIVDHFREARNATGSFSRSRRLEDQS